MEKDKTIVITGATGVIGTAVAERFAHAGWRILLSARSAEKLAALQNTLVPQAATLIFAADLSRPEEVKKLFGFAEKKFGSLDLLVTAAGSYGEIGALEEADLVYWRDAIEVNLFGTVSAIKYALPLLKKGKGKSIVAFAGGGEGPLPNFSSYASSKGAILRLVETLAAEFAPDGIAINAISPGQVNSGLTDALVKAGPRRSGAKKYAEALRQISGEEKTTSPAEAAKLVFFLSSKEAQGVTGKNISAVWDKWRDLPAHIRELAKTDIYTWRRIKPKDRGYDW